MQENNSFLKWLSAFVLGAIIIFFIWYWRSNIQTNQSSLDSNLSLSEESGSFSSNNNQQLTDNNQQSTNNAQQNSINASITSLTTQVNDLKKTLNETEVTTTQPIYLTYKAGEGIVLSNRTFSIKTDNDTIEIKNGELRVKKDFLENTLDEDTKLKGDVTGKYDETQVGDDSHNHTGTTISQLGVSNFTSPNISQWTNDSNYLVASTLSSSETDPIYNAWDKSTGIQITESQITDLQSYLTSFTELDPVFLASIANTITAQNLLDWTQAFNWGNHASAGYLTSFTELDPIFSAHPVFLISQTNIDNWNTAFGWGNHATAGYLTSVLHNTLSDLQGGQASEYYHLNQLQHTNLTGFSNLTLPSTDGTASQALITDGLGNITFGAPSSAEWARDIANGLLYPRISGDDILIPVGDKIYFRAKNSGFIESEGLGNGIIFGANYSEYARIWWGNLGIGTGASTSARLHAKSSGNTSATYAMKVENSDGTGFFGMRDDGRLETRLGKSFYFGGNSSITGINNAYFDITNTSGGIRINTSNGTAQFGATNWAYLTFLNNAITFPRMNNGANHSTITIFPGTADRPAGNLTVKGGNADTVSVTNINGGHMYVLGGNGATANGNGGNVLLDGGLGYGTGTKGDVVIQGYAMPKDNGINGHILATNGAGRASWTDITTLVDAFWYGDVVNGGIRYDSSGNTSATYAAKIHNSAGTSLWSVRDDGRWALSDGVKDYFYYNKVGSSGNGFKIEQNGGSNALTVYQGSVEGSIVSTNKLVLGGSSITFGLTRRPELTSANYYVRLGGSDGYAFQIDTSGGGFGDQPLNDSYWHAQNAGINAITNITGGKLKFKAGDGSLNSINAANGGNVEIDGGLGYGTGTKGSVILQGTSGLVGIGTTSPTHKLTVQDSNNVVAHFTNGSQFCNIDVSLAGGITCTSDQSLKKNIESLDNSLSQINQLNAVRYHWNQEDDQDQKHYGFIAQEVEQIFPELVSTDKESGKKSLAYTALIPLLTQGIQELDTRLTSLEQTGISADLLAQLTEQGILLNEHETKIADLTERIVALESSVGGMDPISPEEETVLEGEPASLGLTPGLDGEIQFSKDGDLWSSIYLFWDDTEQRLGVGTNLPEATVHVVSAGDAASDSALTIENASGEKLLDVREDGRVSFHEVANITPRSSAPETAELGDVYVNADSGELCFFDGVAWVGVKAGGNCE